MLIDDEGDVGNQHRQAIGKHVQGQLTVEPWTQLGDFGQQEEEGESAGDQAGEASITHPPIAVPRSEISGIGTPLSDKPRDGYDEKQVKANERDNVDQLEDAKPDGAAFGTQACKRDDGQRVGSQDPSEITYVLIVVGIIAAVVQPGSDTCREKVYGDDKERGGEQDDGEAVVVYPSPVMVVLLQIPEIGGFHAESKHGIDHGRPAV